MKTIKVEVSDETFKTLTLISNLVDKNQVEDTSVEGLSAVLLTQGVDDFSNSMRADMAEALHNVVSNSTGKEFYNE